MDIADALSIMVAFGALVALIMSDKNGSTSNVGVSSCSLLIMRHEYPNFYIDDEAIFWNEIDQSV